MPAKLDDLELCWRRELDRLDRRSAAALLRSDRVQGDPRSLRRLLGQALSAAAVDMFDDAQVIEQVAARIESGELVAFRRRRAAGIWSERAASEPPPAAPPVIFAPQVETTWVEIQLLDMVGEPVSGERFRIATPDGGVREGRLNYLGRARVDGITTPGACRISFPDLDAEAWEALSDAETTPGR